MSERGSERGREGGREGERGGRERREREEGERERIVLPPMGAPKLELTPMAQAAARSSLLCASFCNQTTQKLMM